MLLGILVAREAGLQAPEDRADATSPRVRQRWARPALLAFGTLMTAIATVAAAVSGWAAMQSIAEAKNAQLLGRRVEACFEIDRRAAGQLAPILAAVRETATTNAEAAISGELADVYGYNSGSDYYFSYMDHVAEIPCASGEEESVCSARRARVVAYYENMLGLSQRVEAIRAATEFETSRTFALIGPPALAEAEVDLLRRLRDVAPGRLVPLSEEHLAAVQLAVTSHGEFRATCQRTFSEYQAR